MSGSHEPSPKPSRYTPERAEETFVAALIEHPDLRRLFHYWRGKRQGRRMPALADIDALEIGWALSRLFVMDFRPDDGFRYRLAGAEVAQVFNRGNLKGLRFFDLLPPEGARVVEARWRQMVAAPSVLCMKGLVYHAAERTPIGERLVMPLAEDPDGPMTGVLGMTVCEWIVGAAPTEVRQSPMKFLPVAEIP
jgi:hypothetical protein